MSQTAYRHSEAFSKLKRIQETIPNNLTTVEYLKTLDLLLESAFLPILESTRFIDTFLAKILAWQSTNPKRKTTSEGKKDLPSYVTLFLISNSPEQKLKIYNRIGFDRGITMEMIRRWLSMMNDYAERLNIPEPTLEDQRIMYRIQHMLDMNEDGYPFGAYLQTKFWFSKVEYFKSLILEKYTRLCLNTAQQDYVKCFQHKIPLDDVLQIYLMAASKAIDKCDANRGVLTTHIQYWLMSARNVAAKNYLESDGKATPVVIPESQEIVEKFVSEDSRASEASDKMFESVEDKFERQGTIDRVRQVAKFFDPTGYGRLVMGIGEYLSPKMSQTLDEHQLKQKQKPENKYYGVPSSVNPASQVNFHIS
jgi:hypothetical protein